MPHYERNEQRINLEDLPKHARSVIEEYRAVFEAGQFHSFEFTKRQLYAEAQGEIQYSVFGIGDSSEVVTHGLYLRKKHRGLLSLFGFKPVARRNRMLQSLFDNGVRLVTTDLYSPSGRAKFPGVRWISVDKSITFENLFGEHLRNKALVLTEESCKILRITCLEQYWEFTEKYEYE